MTFLFGPLQTPARLPWYVFYNSCGLSSLVFLLSLASLLSSPLVLRNELNFLRRLRRFQPFCPASTRCFAITFLVALFLLPFLLLFLIYFSLGWVLLYPLPLGLGVRFSSAPLLVFLFFWVSLRLFISCFSSAKCWFPTSLAIATTPCLRSIVAPFGLHAYVWVGLVLAPCGDRDFWPSHERCFEIKAPYHPRRLIRAPRLFWEFDLQSAPFLMQE